MKCDELKLYRTHTDNLGDNYIDAEFVDVVLKEDVDAAITELKQKLHDAEMRADIAEAANTEYRIDLKNIKDNIAKHARNQYHKHNRQTLRALWLARALALSRFDVDEYLRKYTHCNSRFWNDGFNTFNEACKQMQKAINIAEAKCRAKAEEYK